MVKINKHIEIVASNKSALSSMNGASRRAALEVLQTKYMRVGITIVNSGEDLIKVKQIKPDLVFLGMDYIPESKNSNENIIWMGDWLEANKITYTGSTKKAHALEHYKSHAKQQVLAHGLKTAAYIVILQGDQLKSGDHELVYPLFVKPVSRGGGSGIDANSVVFNFEQLKSKVEAIGQIHKSDSLIEQYLTGREFSVAILRKPESEKYYTMALELEAPEDENGHKMLGSEVKSANTEVVSKISDSGLRQIVESFGLKVFHALSARDYGRIDIRLDEAGEPHFLEANLIPSLIDRYGSFPKACKLNADIDHTAMIFNIVELALERTPINEEVKTSALV